MINRGMMVPPGSYGSEEWYDYDSYWNDWYDDWNEPTAYWDSHDQDRYEEELMPDENSNDPEETQLREAFALAGEANKTLQQARDAVRRVRQARGYFAPESMTGKGKSSTGSPSSSTGKGKSSSKGKSGKGFGPCFICNSPHHGYQNCPDRFSKGFSKSSGKGKPGKKGKGSGKSSKGKGKAYFHEVELHVMTVQWDDLAAHGRAHTRVVLDTGATENAVGIDSLHDMIFSGGFQYQVCCSDLPVFKFGNGHRDRAVSRVDLLNTSLGQVSFYVLGGTGRTTPPLLGARTLRSKRTLISYDNGVFLHRTGDRDVHAVQMQALQSGHITIDLAEKPMILDVSNVFQAVWFQELDFKGMSGCSEFSDANLFHEDSQIERIYMMEAEGKTPSLSMQQLARRLKNLQRSLGEREDGLEVGSSSMRRSQDHGISVLSSTQARTSAQQPTCGMGDLHSMRPSTSVLSQEGQGWQLQANGAGTTPDSIGLERIGADSGCSDGHIQHGDREDYGNQREDVADGNQHSSSHQHDVPRVHETTGDVWTGGSTEVISSTRDHQKEAEPLEQSIQQMMMAQNTTAETKGYPPRSPKAKAEPKKVKAEMNSKKQHPPACEVMSIVSSEEEETKEKEGAGVSSGQP